MDDAMTGVPMLDETWLPVPKCPGYEGSDYGQVRSLDRKVQTSAGLRSYRGKILQPWIGSTGYEMVTLTQEDLSRRVRKVHQIIAETFIGPRPDGLIVLHGPGGQLDNRVVNLSYGTHSDNRYDSVRDGTHWSSLLTHCSYGHPLSHPNLAAYQARLGRRRCLACARAGAALFYARQQGLYLDHQVVADEKYAAILRASAA